LRHELGYLGFASRQSGIASIISEPTI
jgi:hypothetical protein